MRTEIIAVGTELLMGELVDTDSSYIASELISLGFEVDWMSKSKDRLDHLTTALSNAWTRADLIVTCGGLGPTSDDLTREAIAELMGEKMIVDPNLLKHLESIFSERNMPMPDTNLKQATLIPSAVSINNHTGTAPGWWVEKNNRKIIAIPGPPREVKEMWDKEIGPRLQMINENSSIETLTLKTFGISEGRVDEMLSQLFKINNPELGIYSKADGIHLRLIAKADSKKQAHELICPIETQIRNIMGESIWGTNDETPQSNVSSLLSRLDLKVGIFETYTGGTIYTTLGDSELGLKALAGTVIIRDQSQLVDHSINQSVIEKYGENSSETVKLMASKAKEIFHSDIGISITGDESNIVHIGFNINEKSYAIDRKYPGDKARVLLRASTEAFLKLDMLLRENYDV